PTTTTTGPTANTAVAVELETVKNVSYDEMNALDVYMPIDGRTARTAVLVLIEAPFRLGFDRLVDALTAEGVAVVIVNWTGDPSLAAVEGVACAVRFVRVNADSYGVDPERIILIGHSGSASVAALIALGGDHFSDVACEAAGVSALPNAYLGLAGSYDPANHPADPRLPFLTSDPDLYAALNPVSYLGENPEIEIRLIHGDADEIIPVVSAVSFEKVLRDAGYSVNLTVLEGSGHGLLVSGSVAEFQVTIDEILAAAGG
ncbi:MAG: alpha/beta hydrolase, partial [Acidimicrobiia bacterium]